MFKKILIFLFLFFLLRNNCEAARNMSISSNKSSLSGDEELVLTASVSGFTNGETIYIKGAFYQEGSTNYFGYTKSGDVFIKNGDSSSTQRQIKIGDWDGSVTLKRDSTDSGYQGEGEYDLKLGFYYLTSGGNLSSINWSSNILSVNINEEDAAPTLIPSPTSVKTPFTPLSSKVISPTPSKISSTSISNSGVTFAKIADDLRVGSGYASLKEKLTVKKHTPTPSPEVRVLGVREKSSSFVVITIGFLLLWIGGGWVLYKEFNTRGII